jgi:serpin B
MIFILPDEDSSVDEVLGGDSLYEFLAADRNEWKEQQTATVVLSLPKFDVSSQLDLIDGLKSLGIRDVFDPDVSDFTPMMEDADGLYVSTATHAARVKVDEEGCEAAAFTVFSVDESAPLEEPDEICFTLDRPFLFVIESESGQPLFIGVVREL